jgi:VWFA-related protein
MLQRNIQRSGLLGGLIIFAIVWTILMGLGVSGASPSSAGGGSSASTLGAGAHIMYVDESRFPAITVYLAVNDAEGEVITGLQKDDFTLREDGAEVTITDFVGAGGGSSSTMLVIDQSHSMAEEDKLAGAIRAAQTYINLLQPGADQLGVITFSSFSVTLAPLGEVTEQGRMVLNGLLGGLFTLPGTEFYAATREGIKALEAVEGRKVVLALTDGMDNSGQAGLPQTVTEAQAAKTPIYAVGLGSDVDRAGLERLARETGGQVYFSPSAAELEALYSGIASGLRNEYALTYQSLTPNLDGTQRALDVAIATGSEDLETGGGYSVGGILASGLNLALFAPTLLVLFVALAGLYFAPDFRRRKRQSEAAPPGQDRAERKIEHKPDVLPPTGQDCVQDRAPVSPRMTESAPIPQAPPVASQVAVPPPVCLVVVHRLQPPETVIGSAAGSTLLLPAVVAPQQARIHFSAGRYAIDDLAGSGTTQVSYAGDPAQLRPVQRNALREGSLVQLGPLRYVFRQAAEGAWLEQRLPLPAGGLSIGTDGACDLAIAAGGPQRVQIRAEGKHWLVERLAGECEVSFSGSPEQLRPVLDRNALRPGSSLQVGGVLLRLEPV